MANVVTLLEGNEATTVSAGRFLLPAAMADAATVWVSYNKGNSTSLNLTFEGQDSRHPSAALWFTLTDVSASGAISSKNATFSATGLYVVEIDIPIGVEDLVVNATFTGGTTATAEIWLNLASKYS